LVIHVVGFGLDPKERKQLEALAKIGKGNYYNAADAGQSSSGLRQAMASIRFIGQDKGRHKTNRPWRDQRPRPDAQAGHVLGQHP